jgi:threonylcarbamoyladenosine tRNA methylthiotransferase MtaB
VDVALPRVALVNLGCKVNIAELQSLEHQLRVKGYQIVSEDERADVYVLNTCTVTHVADKKSRQLARRLKRLNPGAIVVATGCYVELLSRESHTLEGVDVMVPQADKALLADTIVSLVPPNGGWSPQASLPACTRVRGFVKVQDGCNEYCTFCTIPKARGGILWSAALSDVLAEVRQRLQAGHKEILITGVHLGKYRYRAPDGRITIFDLVRSILRETEVPRLRISSLEPHDFDPRLLELWSDPRVCRHVHLALQSGCDATLLRMRRGYSAAQFWNLVETIRRAVPGISITTDVIVGFPGETDAEFEESYAFARDLGFSRIHVFPFSARPGTAAAAMPRQVPDEVKSERAERFRSLGRQLASEWHRQFRGRLLSVLWEEASVGGASPLWQGYTDNYIRVRLASRRNLTNKITTVLAVDADHWGLWGRELA